MGASPSKATETEDHAPNTPNCSKPIIFVLGGPGTGKGTQCGRLTKEFGFKHLSVGDLLRDEVKKGTTIGKQCAGLMKEGKLVPVKISLGLLKNAMKESNSQKGFLIDGFPRACNQARAFEKQLKRPVLVIYLHAPMAVLQKRLLNRGQTSGRSDDNSVSIRKRFVTFRKESLPVVGFYEKLPGGLVKRVMTFLKDCPNFQICTIRTPDEVYTEVREAVNRVLNAPLCRRRVFHKQHKRRWLQKRSQKRRRRRAPEPIRGRVHRQRRRRHRRPRLHRHPHLSVKKSKVERCEEHAVIHGSNEAVSPVAKPGDHCTIM